MASISLFFKVAKQLNVHQVQGFRFLKVKCVRRQTGRHLTTAAAEGTMTTYI